MRAAIVGVKSQEELMLRYYWAAFTLIGESTGLNYSRVMKELEAAVQIG